MPNAILITPSGASRSASRIAAAIDTTVCRADSSYSASAVVSPLRTASRHHASSLWTKSDVISVVTALKPFTSVTNISAMPSGRELALEETRRGFADGETPRRGHSPFERLDRLTDESHLRGAQGACARCVDDGRRCANELDLPRALEQRLLGHELAAAGDVAESRVGAVGEEVRRGSHGDQRGDRQDRDGDDRGSR